MNKLTILTNKLNFRKLLLAALPVITVITLSITLGVVGDGYDGCIFDGAMLICPE